MIVYSNNNDQGAEKILHSDIKFMTKQLGEFIKVYENKIYIQSQDCQDTLDKLKYIYDKLNNQQYDQLINDPSIISYDEFNIDDGEVPF